MGIREKNLENLENHLYFNSSNFNYNIKHFKVTLYYMTELQVDKN